MAVDSFTKNSIIKEAFRFFSSTTVRPSWTSTCVGLHCPSTLSRLGTFDTSDTFACVYSIQFLICFAYLCLLLWHLIITLVVTEKILFIYVGIFIMHLLLVEFIKCLTIKTTSQFLIFFVNLHQLILHLKIFQTFTLSLLVDSTCQNCYVRSKCRVEHLITIIFKQLKKAKQI